MKSVKFIVLSLLISTIANAQGNSHQTKIDAAFEQSFVTQTNKIETIIDKLKLDKVANAYWIAYAQFYSSIFYMQTGQKDKAEKSVADAIDLLQSIDEKDSEEHALLGYILGFSISINPENAIGLSAKAADQYQAALKKDKNNMRAYLGLGESDYHKPTMYGGGRKVEEYLLKAISLPDQSMANGPSWGKNSAYYTLASFYKREGQIDKAKMYCMKGLSEFPQDYQLNQLKQSF